MTPMKAEKGTYALVLSLADEAFFNNVGPFGAIRLPGGYFVYVGSALGSGGVRGRIAHHMRFATKPHWHLDYVRPAMFIEEAWCTYDPTRRECGWSRLVCEALNGVVLLPGFGSEDCKLCPCHFYYFRQRPSWRTFAAAVQKRFPRHGPIARIKIVDDYKPGELD